MRATFLLDCSRFTEVVDCDRLPSSSKVDSDIVVARWFCGSFCILHTL